VDYIYTDLEKLYQFVFLPVNKKIKQEKWKPDSFYDRIKNNLQFGSHTLCLLDIKVKEQSEYNLLRDRKIYEPPRYMSINLAIEQILEIESIRKENIISENTIGVGIARIGSDDQKIISGTLKELLDVDFGEPLHSLILCGDLHYMEKEVLDFYKVNENDLRILKKVENVE
jgi:diphthine methyl ester synthase